MRLLYLCSDFGIDPNGTKGASIHLRAITRAMCAVGHEVSILSPKGKALPDHPAQVLEGVTGGPAETMGRLLKNWLLDHDLDDAAARELRPLLYNAWALEPAINVLKDDPPETIIERLSLFGHVGVDLAAALDVPLVVEMNAPLAEEAEVFRSLQLRTLAREIERRVLARADAVVVVSEALAQRLIESGLDAKKVHVLPNGADPLSFDAVPAREACRARWNLEGAFVVGFVGSLKPWHGVDVLLRTAERLMRDDPDVRVLVVGNGPSADSLHELAAQLNIDDRVVFAGALPHKEIPAAMRAMDVAVAPFTDVPGFYFSPIKLFEYMAAGLCVVASRLGQIREVIDDGRDGLLCEPGSEESLLHALRRLRRDAALRERLGAAAIRTVRDRYTWRHTAQRLTGVIETALERRGSTRDEVRVG